MNRSGSIRTRLALRLLIRNLQALNALGGRLEHAARLDQDWRNLGGSDAHFEHQ
jgi:hypothetical protein